MIYFHVKTLKLKLTFGLHYFPRDFQQFIDIPMNKVNCITNPDKYKTTPFNSSLISLILVELESSTENVQGR